MTEIVEFFLNHPHLQFYVRHLQVQVPIWEKSGDDHFQRYPSYVTRAEPFRHMPGYIFHPMTPVPGVLLDQRTSASQDFRPASKNTALTEIFACAQALFPALFALTIECGHCQRPPQIKYFPPHPSKVLASQSSKTKFKIPVTMGPYLPTLSPVRVLILKGTWSVVRQPSELDVIMKAVPNLNEFHSAYHSFVAKGYTTMCAALRAEALQPSIKHVNVSLESYYSKDPSTLEKWKEIYPGHHFCRVLGSIASSLPSLTYPGRLCGSLFSEMMKAAEKIHPITPSLRRIDIIVQNVCRDLRDMHDGTGIHNWRFIQAFEIIIFQSVAALKFYTDVNFVRIRYIDLDAPDPPILPAFYIEGRKAWGFWSDRIYQELNKVRPDVYFETGHSIHGDADSSRSMVTIRRSHSLEFYHSIADSLVVGSVI